MLVPRVHLRVEVVPDVEERADDELEVEHPVGPVDDRRLRQEVPDGEGVPAIGTGQGSDAQRSRVGREDLECRVVDPEEAVGRARHLVLHRS
jgi:hypothetical protein